MPSVVLVADAYPTREAPRDGSFIRDQAMALAARLPVGVARCRTISPRQWLAGTRANRGASTWLDGHVCIAEASRFTITTRLRRFDVGGRAAALSDAIRAMEPLIGRPGLIHAHGVAFAGETAVEVARRMGLPVVITEHYSQVPDLIGHYGRRLLDVYDRADLVLGVSSHVAAMLRRLGVRREVVAVPNVVDVDEFEFAEPSPRPSGRWELLCVARDHPVKDVPTLVRALGRLRGRVDVRCRVVGPGTYTEVMSHANRLSLNGSLRFVGGLGRPEVARLMRESHLVVCSSRSETFGLSLAEAMCVGRPVVATRCGGPEDFVDASNGVLVPVGDADALADGIVEALDLYERYEARGISSRARARFAPNRWAPRLMGLYRSILSGRA